MQNRKLRNALAKLCLSSHQLYIETSHHRNIQKANRKCVLCNLNETEDEVHFTLLCPAYVDLKTVYPQIFLSKTKCIQIHHIIKFFKTKST